MRSGQAQGERRGPLGIRDDKISRPAAAIRERHAGLIARQPGGHVNAGPGRVNRGDQIIGRLGVGQVYGWPRPRCWLVIENVPSAQGPAPPVDLRAAAAMSGPRLCDRL